jgi:protein-tyrosine phosphatase
MAINILFVCLGNICRSPTAHGVFQRLVDHHRLRHAIHTDSAGTGDWHIGRAPDQRATAAARKRGYDLSVLRARQVSAADFSRFDYILAMDAQNLRDLQILRPANFAGELDLFLHYASSYVHKDGGHLSEVPDPYYGGDDGFEQVLDLIEDAAQGLLQAIAQRHRIILNQ